nr:hypothetical protein [Tanacetum cinerariifolium]
MFQQGEDLIECINKAMAFLSTVASRFPPLNNQLRTSSNPINQATIQDAGPSRVVKCYNCQREGHMARQCTQPKWPRNAAWFKEKLMLAEAQETGQIFDEEQLAFLADPAILMANLSSCDPDVLSEEIDSLKETLFNNVKEKESLSKTLTVFKTESKEKESKYIDKEIVLEKQNKELENIIMFKLDIEPISPRLKNNKDAHEKLLVYVSMTCPNSPKPSEKLVVVILINKDKRVRFSKPITSSSNIPKHTDSLKTTDSNKPLLTSTGVKPTTSASGSKPSGNT